MENGLFRASILGLTPWHIAGDSLLNARLRWVFPKGAGFVHEIRGAKRTDVNDYTACIKASLKSAYLCALWGDPGLRIRVLFPNRLSMRSAASWPVLATISMHS